MDFRGINDNLNTYYDELFTNEYLIKYGYYSYKKSKMLLWKNIQIQMCFITDCLILMIFR